MKTTNCFMPIAAALLAACGGSSSSGGGGGCPPTAGVTIASTGVTPQAVCILVGGTVTFTNSDTVSHDIESGATCTQLNLGPIAPGTSKTTVAFPAAASCPFHDQSNPTNAAFMGTVTVTARSGY